MSQAVISLLVLFVLLVPAGSSVLAAGATSEFDVCKSSVCKVSEVGPFMQDITAACYNTGTCSLADIMTVVNNVGVFILGIVGSLVLLMYVVGGIMYLTAGANPDNAKKGKSYIKIASVGLIIVFGAYAAIQTIDSFLDRAKTTESSGASSAPSAK